MRDTSNADSTPQADVPSGAKDASAGESPEPSPGVGGGEAVETDEPTTERPVHSAARADRSSAAPEPPENAAVTEGPTASGNDGRALYISYCGACHSLEVVEGQRLDRDNWNWVLDDMIEQYGADWITGEERELIIDHLVREFGPGKPR